jgi:tetrahydromethanopterin S-methyltransferase subunit G
MSDERIAVLEAEFRNMREDLSEIKTDVKTLVNERHESIGKKSVWTVIWVAIGTTIGFVIDLFRQ